MLRSIISRGLVLIGLSLLLLSGCGQKGDLYIPEPEQAFTSHF